uniref:Uncharacterized protein n=1 Tax=Triticum urartu TaxID=4572 RepID=A0A8R7QBV0_TRIUA
MTRRQLNVLAFSEQPFSGLITVSIDSEHLAGIRQEVVHVIIKCHKNYSPTETEFVSHLTNEPN